MSCGRVRRIAHPDGLSDAEFRRWAVRTIERMQRRVAQLDVLADQYAQAWLRNQVSYLDSVVAELQAAVDRIDGRSR